MRKSMMRLAIAVAMTVPMSVAMAAGKVHNLLLQINDNDEARMQLTLNNAANVMKVYQDKGEEVHIDIVAYGPGLNFLREDKASDEIKTRIKSMKQSFETVSFIACGNTKTNMEKKEGKEVKLIEQAKLVPAGVVHIMEHEEAGWSYVRP
ncbi:MAG: DsrE family protein [Gammaproteobacteria bacterium]|nr:DsrE family protein [Gammaproteobacteria bacterium]